MRTPSWVARVAPVNSSPAVLPGESRWVFLYAERREDAMKEVNWSAYRLIEIVPASEFKGV